MVCFVSFIVTWVLLFSHKLPACLRIYRDRRWLELSGPLWGCWFFWMQEPGPCVTRGSGPSPPMEDEHSHGAPSPGSPGLYMHTPFSAWRPQQTDQYFSGKG